MKLTFALGFVIVFATTLAACKGENDIEFDHYYSGGMVVYQSSCQNCHGEKGEGLVNLMPPLTDSVYLKNNKGALACAIKYGQNRSIKVAGRDFDGNMPANGQLSPVEIAEVLTYVTNSFGNKLGTVTTQQVNNYLAKCK